jgi:hypothetical protein
LTQTTGAAPDAGADSHISLTGGSAITNTTFLGSTAEGQHQDTVNSHDQTVHVAKSRKTTIAEFEERNINKGRTTTVKENENLIVQGNRSVNVTEISTLTAKKVEITGREEVKIHVGSNHITINKDGITVYAKNKVAITGEVEITLQGPGENMITLDETGVTIQGAPVKIN